MKSAKLRPVLIMQNIHLKANLSKHDTTSTHTDQRQAGLWSYFRYHNICAVNRKNSRTAHFTFLLNARNQEKLLAIIWQYYH